MRSERGMLKVGSLYKLHNHDELCIECIRQITNDPYSRHSAYVRSIITGWTMIVHGTNIYEDGSIDWDFSTNGHFTDKCPDGVLVERRY